MRQYIFEIYGSGPCELVPITVWGLTLACDIRSCEVRPHCLDYEYRYPGTLCPSPASLPQTIHDHIFFLFLFVLKVFNGTLNRGGGHFRSYLEWPIWYLNRSQWQTYYRPLFGTSPACAFIREWIKNESMIWEISGVIIIH